MANTLQQRITAMEGYLKTPRIANDPAGKARIEKRLVDARAQLGSLATVSQGVQGAQQKANEIGQSIQALQAQSGSTTAGTTGTTGTTTGGTTAGTTPNTNDGYQKFLLDTITQQNKYMKNYIDTLKKQPSSADQYKTYSEQEGLPAQQKLVAGVQQQVLDVEGLLSKLEGDINTRSSGHLVTEAQRRRYLATEGKPLRTSLTDLMRDESRASAGYSAKRQEVADMMKNWSADQAKQLKMSEIPLSQGYKNLPYYKEALTYETPAQKSKRLLAEKLAEQNALKTTSTTSTTKSAAKKVFDEGGGKNAWGMDFVKWYKEIYKKSTTQPTELKMNDDMLRGIVSAGVPEAVAKGIWEDLKSGFSLEEIRQNLKAQFGKDKGYSYLDIAMPIIQGQ